MMDGELPAASLPQGMHLQRWGAWLASSMGYKNFCFEYLGGMLMTHMHYLVPCGVVRCLISLMWLEEV